MPFTRYKKYLFLSDDNLSTTTLSTSTNLMDCYTSNLAEQGYVPQDEIEKVLRSPTVRRFYKYYLLHDDETILEDISDMVLDNGNIQKNAQTGQTRSLNLTLVNEKRNVLVGYKDGKGVYEKRYLWTPTPFENKLWYYNKIKVVTCLLLDNYIYEIDEGIFIIFDPNIKENNGNQTVDIQLYDKFSLLDGTIDGQGDVEYTINLSTPIKQAIQTLIRLPKNKDQQPYDFKEIIFPIKYNNLTTAYTIKKSGDNAIGELLKELCLSISCDISYNTSGQLEIRDSLADLDYHNRKVAWQFKEGEFFNPTIKVNRSKIKNKVTVKGANINGILCSATVENTNPLSAYNIYSDFGVKGHIIEDSLLSSSFLCKERARYELKKYIQNYINITLQSIYIPHIQPGDIVIWSYPQWGIENKPFLVNNVSIPLKASTFMSLTLVNLDELPL